MRPLKKGLKRGFERLKCGQGLHAGRTVFIISLTQRKCGALMRDTCLRIVDLLGNGEYVSGAVLGDKLGVSRTAIWKHLNKLLSWGVPIEKVKGRGYCIRGGMELLEADLIQKGMTAQASSLMASLQVLATTRSTNEVVRDHIEQGATKGVVCFAERQTGGRGRHGREWSSPFGRNLYMSLSWGYDGGAAALEGLSLTVGVVVAQVIRSFGVNDVALKWPNDILLERKKVAGVLLEMMGDPVGSCQVIVGIGINLGMDKDVDVGQPWADLSESSEAGRNELASALLSALLPVLDDYSGSGFAAYRAHWEELDAFRNSPIKLITPRLVVRGIGRGVTDTGAIQIEAGGVVESYSGGEISLRGDDDS